ncbi:MAG: hypothetical protein QW734_05540 [Candidatus Bathyarchaeia archaeon]
MQTAKTPIISLLLIIAALICFINQETPPPGNYEICYLTVHAKRDNKPLPTLKVKVYKFNIFELTSYEGPPLPLPDPDQYGDPYGEGYTDNNGEITFVVSPGNYTIKLEFTAKTFDLRVVECKRTYHDVYFEYFTPQKEETSPLISGILTPPILLGIILIMAGAVMLLLQKVKK